MLMTTRPAKGTKPPGLNPRLAARGYRLSPGFDGCHILWSADWGDDGAPAYCLGCLPPDRAWLTDLILERMGWPTCAIAACPDHGVEHA